MTWQIFSTQHRRWMILSSEAEYGKKTHPDPASKSARVLVDIDLTEAVARGAMARRIAADNSAMVQLFLCC